MRLDVQGNLYVAAGINRPRHSNETGEVPAGIYMISPVGELMGRISIPKDAIAAGPSARIGFVVVEQAR